MLFALGLMLAVASANDSFVLTSFKDAKFLSESTEKPILLIFGTNSCKFCTELKSAIFVEPLKSATDKYIICYLDLDENPELKQEYDISIIPDSRIIKNNKQISGIKGYTASNYLKWLNNVK
jgi:thioredoxin-related protein